MAEFLEMSNFDPNMWDVSSAMEDADTYDIVQAGGYAIEQALIKNSERIPVIGDGVEGLIDLTKAGAYYGAEALSGSDWVDSVLQKFGL